MFIPYDYQIDYLKALHTFYYAYPNPIRILYYSLADKQEIANATETTKSYYSHPLDDTSIATYNKINNFPVYFTQPQDPRQNRATETGNLATGAPFTVVIPAIYGLQPEIDDFLYFTSTGAGRMFRVINIEYVNLFEQSNLRAFKIEIQPDKYYENIVIEKRVTTEFDFMFEFSRILRYDNFDLVNDKLLPLIMFNLLKLDTKTRPEYVDVFLTKFYTDYLLYFDVILNKGEYQYFNLFFKDYLSKDYAHLFQMPDVVLNIKDVNNLEQIKSCVKNINSNTNCDLLPTFSSDYIARTLKPQYEAEIKQSPIARIIIIKYCFDLLKTIIEGT